MAQSYREELAVLGPEQLHEVAFTDDQITQANHELRAASADERIDWAVRAFPVGLYALTSAGVDSALTLEHVSKPGRQIPVIHINTGFRPAETLTFRDQLREEFSLEMVEYGPNADIVDAIRETELWISDPAEYGRLTKVEPLARAIGELSVTALISGVRGDQTSTRSELDVVGRGKDGEIRVHPFIDWSKQRVDDYIDSNALPRHPLWPEYGSVEDAQTMVPGNGREGRSFDECGIHIVDGRVVRSRAS